MLLTGRSQLALGNVTRSDGMIERMRPARESRHTRILGDGHAPRRRYLVALLAAMTVLASCSTAISGTASRDEAARPGDTSGSSSNADGGGDTDGVENSTPNSGPGTHHITEPESPPASTQGTGASDGDLSRYYSQQLDWGPCGPYAVSATEQGLYSSSEVECARLTVPMDYDEPTGTTITIGVLRQHATGEKIGSVVFNPGGPGASGMSIVAQLAVYGIAENLAQHFDFVGFDPRGVGSSEPHIACLSDEERDHARAINWPGFMPSSTPQEVQAANDTSKWFIQGCLDKISAQGVDAKAFLAQVGTVNVAKDLDVLRAVLGDEKLTYVGWSYGTSIGTQYAEQFPDNVRAMILDGAIDPEVDAATDSLQQTKAFQQAFNNFAAWCAPRDGCPWQSADVANRRFQAMAQPLMDLPLALPDGRKLTFLDAVIGVANSLYSEASWPTLLGALNGLSSGSGAGLMAQADSYYRRDSSGHYTQMLDAFNAIRCMDSNRITDPDRAAALNAKLVAASPFQDNGEPAAAIFDVCAFWPVPPTLLPHTPDPEGLPPVLVISTTDDPATPYQSGVNLAEDLGARLLTVDGTHHTSYMLSGLQCVNRIGDDYLINLTLPDQGASCP